MDFLGILREREKERHRKEKALKRAEEAKKGERFGGPGNDANALHAMMREQLNSQCAGQDASSKSVNDAKRPKRGLGWIVNEKEAATENSAFTD